MLLILPRQYGLPEIEQFSKDASKRPHVRLMVIIVSHNDLRRSVVESDNPSSILSRIVFCTLAENSTVALRETEIGQFHDALRIDEYIAKFQVAMNDKILVKMQHRIENLQHDALDVAF